MYTVTHYNYGCDMDGNRGIDLKELHIDDPEETKQLILEEFEKADCAWYGTVEIWIEFEGNSYIWNEESSEYFTEDEIKELNKTKFKIEETEYEI